jgi:hypothetical protein
MNQQINNQPSNDNLMPYGVLGNFILMMLGLTIIMAILIIPILILELIDVIYVFPCIMLPGFCIAFFWPLSFNNKPSIFEQNRSVINSKISGGVISFFKGSSPIFKTLLYSDGIEIRVMFNRFFIPYSQLIELRKNKGIFAKGVTLKSKIDGVPATIQLNIKDDFFEEISQLSLINKTN